MAVQRITEAEFRVLLSTFVGHCGSLTAAAGRFGVSAQFLGDVLKGNRRPSEKILQVMGYRRVVLYEKVRG